MLYFTEEKKLFILITKLTKECGKNGGAALWISGPSLFTLELSFLHTTLKAKKYVCSLFPYPQECGKQTAIGSKN
jgi:hypothetical protein